jgi:uncharacterized protein YndB with AHSA1/START domain
MKPQVERTADGLVVSAVFNAPRERVFAAWTDPQRVQSWWGCAQATSVESTVDLRVGGVYRHVMQVAGCGECIADGVFTEVDPPRRLAFRMKGQNIEGYPPVPDSTTTVEFTALGNRTEVRLTVVGLAGTPFEGIVAEGWTAGLEKLGEVVSHAETV